MSINVISLFIFSDLRTLYVQFVLAFFVHGDSDIKKQVIGVKGLMNGIFTHITEDAYQVFIYNDYIYLSIIILILLF